MIKVEHYTETEVYAQKDASGEGWRSELMEGLVRFHYQTYYRSFYQDKQAWGFSVEYLLSFPDGSLGYELGLFLQSHNYRLIPKFENHDVFHVVLAYEPVITDEIQMQFCLAGSGRRTLSTLATIMIGTAFYPRHIIEFIKAYRRGLSLSNFSSQEFKPLLERPLQELKDGIGC